MSSQCSLKNYKFRREVKNSKIEEIWESCKLWVEKTTFDMHGVWTQDLSIRKPGRCQTAINESLKKVQILEDKTSSVVDKLRKNWHCRGLNPGLLRGRQLYHPLDQPIAYQVCAGATQAKKVSVCLNLKMAKNWPPNPNFYVLLHFCFTIFKSQCMPGHTRHTQVRGPWVRPKPNRIQTEPKQIFFGI